MGESLLRRIRVPHDALSLIILSLGAALASAAEPGPPSRIGISYPRRALITDPLKVQIYVLNPTDANQVYYGEPVDPNGSFSRSGGWNVTVEQLRDGAVIASKSVDAPVGAVARAHVLPPRKRQFWRWSAPLGQLVEKPGDYRLKLTYRSLSSTGRVVQVVTSLATPDYIKTEYIPEKNTFFMGELMKVHFVMTNNGPDDFDFESGGDYRGASRHLRYYFTGVSQDGHKAVDPRPSQSCMGGLTGARPLRPGERREIPLYLAAYLSFPVPGRYTIKGYQDLGFGAPAPELKGLPYLAKAGHPERAYGGSFEIDVRKPSVAEQYGLINAALSQSDKRERDRRLSLLHYRLYLKPLLQCLRHRADEEDIGALTTGIGSILTVEATRELIRLCRDDRTAVRTRALQALAGRLPPKLSPWYDPPPDPQKWRQPELERAWDKSLLSLLPDIVTAALHSDVVGQVCAATGLVSRLGDPNMLPLLAQAADRFGADTAQAEKNLWVLQCLGSAAYTLQAYEPAPITATKDSSPGRLVVWSYSVSHRPELHDEHWQDLVLHMMRLDCYVTQEYSVYWLPKDFRGRDQIPWKKLLASPHESVWRPTLRQAERDLTPELRAVVTEVLGETTDEAKKRVFKELLGLSETPKPRRRSTSEHVIGEPLK